MNKIKDRSTIPFHIVKAVLLTILSILCVLPFIVIISGSLTDNLTILRDGFSIFPRNLTIESYRTIFRSPAGIIQAYKMNFYYTFMGTALGLLVITLTAYVISRKDFKYRNHVSFLIYFTTIFGGGMIPWYMMYTNVLNLRGTTLAIWFPALMSPFLVILMRGGIGQDRRGRPLDYLLEDRAAGARAGAGDRRPVPGAGLLERLVPLVHVLHLQRDLVAAVLSV